MTDFELAAPNELIADAVISGDGRFRFMLGREWAADTTKLGFIMLNPSTADGMVDDPTIRRCVGFAKRGGFGGIRVANLFALRATKPADLLAAIDGSPDRFNVTGSPFADEWIARMNGMSVVVAWGATFANELWHANRIDSVVKLLDRSPLLCLGTTKDGHPRHPLYVRADAPLIEWGTRWDPTVPPGGTVCSVCGIPVESEPCEEHGLPRDVDEIEERSR